MAVTTSVINPAPTLEFPQRFIVAMIPQCEGRPGEPLYEAMMVAAPPDVPKGVFAVYDFNQAPSIVFDAWITEQISEHEVDVSALIADVDRAHWTVQNRWRIIGALREQGYDMPVFRENSVAQSVAATLNGEAKSHAATP